jgi:hypothetical protein
MQVKDLTIEQFRALIQEVIEETLQDLLLYPDAGKTLKPAVVTRLTQIRQQRDSGQLTLHSAEDVAARLY